MSASSCMRPVSAPESIALRVMKSSDLPHVRALHRRLLPVSYPAAFFIQLAVNSQQLCVVATERGSIIGFASASMDHARDTRADPDIPRSHVTLLTLGVLPEYQRRGIGRSLVCEVIRRLAHDQDTKIAVRVQVHVAHSNAAGKRFYTQLGMTDQQSFDDLRLGSRTSLMAGVLCV